ncbi:glycosyl hydrolase family 43 family protein [Asticcacaulis biprosthecium C19]|uniref:Glycosyl hydrolase family 43 family protein n=1 Tax=Asticcacaulis biprosthecium C19 TaxID=715226 RepID=F4QIJ1_9CAUL|nr:family 43 glycosylhydrolase [Asticcacaulis biprosthecium]EGF92980.1 glycosyl hydrolase family 43 family protein [Asticcacaulis biprosthecium C19]
MTTRRNLFTTLAANAVLTPAVLTPAVLVPAVAVAGDKRAKPQWGTGPEGQRKADLGDGTYLNPIIAGDHPDPTILKDGDDYYMTFSSFFSYPGLVIWHSTDLVNWTPVGPALFKPLGTIWAVDLCKHNDRYFIYIPAAPDGKPWSIYAIWAADIKGPWSDPVDLNIHDCIDPGHIVGEDGKRYLFVNGIRKIRLTDDGLAADGVLEPAYQPWINPDDWIVENFAPEGPKLLRRGEYFYLVTAVGGTAGPVTGHMVIAARSKSIHGPWEHYPNNPLVRTLSTDEPWWSRGHATLMEGPSPKNGEADWWLVYHGYENGFRTLGRQTLLEPAEWTKDGWFRALGVDLSKPMRKPKGGTAGPAGFKLSDDFSANRFGIQWSFHDPKPGEMDRVKYEGKGLRLAARGTSPADSAPLTCPVGDRSYEVEVTLELEGEAVAGLLLYYNSKAYVGVGFTGEETRTWQYAEDHAWNRQKITARQLRLRVTNQDNVITWHYSPDDGASWIRHPTRMEVSGMHHNVFGGFLSLKIAICCTGTGAVRLNTFTYRALTNGA